MGEDPRRESRILETDYVMSQLSSHTLSGQLGVPWSDPVGPLGVPGAAWGSWAVPEGSPRITFSDCERVLVPMTPVGTERTHSPWLSTEAISNRKCLCYEVGNQLMDKSVSLLINLVFV